MADSINIPQNLTKVVEVKDTSEPLRRFLIDLLIRVQNLEKQVKTQQDELEKLRGGAN